MGYKQPTIYILIGPPAAGKSTWRNEVFEDQFDAAVISSDDLIDQFAEENDLTYTEAFLKVDHKKITEELNWTFDEAIQDGRDIIVDRTNMSAKSRRSWLGRVPRTYKKAAVVFNISRSKLDERLAARCSATGKCIPSHVVDDMIAKYEEPTEQEFDHIVRIRY